MGGILYAVGPEMGSDWRSILMSVKLAVFESRWGWIGVAVSERGLAGLILPQPTEELVRARLNDGWPNGVQSDGDLSPDLWQALLDYLGGLRTDFSGYALDLPDGPAFWRRVWDACARIPYGETRSYAQLAAEAGSPRAYRAVGAAMAANPIPIVVPCHRVVGSDGRLVGFGGGLDMKERMLAMEKRATAPLL